MKFFPYIDLHAFNTSELENYLGNILINVEIKYRSWVIFISKFCSKWCEIWRLQQVFALKIYRKPNGIIYSKPEFIIQNKLIIFDVQLGQIE